MARKTKEEAQQTYDALLDAAEFLFVKQGVSKTTLQQIAQQANVTRGAVYWHFNDKLALFQALIKRATTPFEQVFERLENNPQAPYLEHITLIVGELFDIIGHDEHIRNFLDIISHKTELVNDFDILRDLHLEHTNRVIGLFSRLLLLAAKNGELNMNADQANDAALCLKAMIDGYFHLWVHASGTFNLRKSGASGVQIFIQGIKAF